MLRAGRSDQSDYSQERLVMFIDNRHFRVFAVCAIALIGCAQSAFGQWAERFDTLMATGGNVAPNKCWDTWDQASAANSVTSGAQFISAPNSILITGTSDTIQRFQGYTSGIWEFKTNVYVPSSSSGRSWFILMNKYLHGIHNNQDWSVQIAFNATTNAIFSQEANVTGTLIEDAWFELKVLINLNTNVAQIYVNNNLFATHPWVGPNGSGGLMQIQCLDLYAESATSVAYHDNISLTRVDDCCVEIDPGTKFGPPFLYDTPLAQTFKPVKTALACEVLTGVELSGVPSYDFYIVKAPGGVVPLNYTTNYLYRALNQTAGNTNGAGPVNCLQDVMNSGLVLWSTDTYAIIIKKNGGSNIMWRATPANTYANGAAWVWDGGIWNPGTGYGIADFTFSINGLINRITRRCGFKDNCALPVDNTWRSPALNAVYPGAPWKQMDDTTSDRWVGHTFRNLPNNIVRARLVFEAIPDATNGGTFNDAITLGLCNNPSNPVPPPYWMFSRRLEALPEANGHWDTNGKTIFTLDLHNLPDGGNVIGMMNATGMLDTWVVDDTTVDWMRLEIWTCPPPLAPFGLPIEVLGNATLGPWDPVERALSLRNLGSSGNDGVDIKLGRASGFSWGITNSNSTLTAPGKSTRSTLFGPRTSSEESPLGSVQTVGHGSFFDVFADFSAIGWSGYTVQPMRADGSVIASVPLAHPNGIQIEPGGGGGGGFKVSFYVWIRDIRIICIVVDLPSSARINGISYDNVRSIALVPTGSGSAECVTKARLTGTNIPEMLATHWRPAFFDVFADFSTSDLNQLGEAHDDGQQVAVSNIGSSGQDGVSVDLDPGKARSAGWRLQLEADLDSDGEYLPGTGFQIDAFGSVGGSPGHPLGSLQYIRSSSFFDIFADFSDIGSNHKRIEVWDHGTFVGAIPNYSPDHIGTASRFPIKFGKLGRFGLKCFWLGYEVPTLFQFGPIAYVGDELRVLTEDVSGPIDYLERMSVTTLKSHELSIWEADVVPATRTVTGTVTLQDFEGNVGAQTVDIEIRPVGSLSPIEVHTVPLDGAGHYTYSTTLLGTYEVTCKASHWLRKKVTMMLSGENVAQDYSLVNGDVDGDNENTLVDYGRIAAAYGKAEGEPGFDPDTDLNGDGETNLVDIGILAAHFGEAGDE